jgi:hypothetical protein
VPVSTVRTIAAADLAGYEVEPAIGDTVAGYRAARASHPSSVAGCGAGSAQDNMPSVE